MDSASIADGEGACALLLAEQRGVEEGFRRLAAARGAREKQAAESEVLKAAAVVLALEEELLYPAARLALGAGRGTSQFAASGPAARRIVAELRAAPGALRDASRVARLRDLLERRFAGERAGLFVRLSGTELDRGRLAGDMREFKARAERPRPRGLGGRLLAAAAALIR